MNDANPLTDYDAMRNANSLPDAVVFPDYYGVITDDEILDMMIRNKIRMEKVLWEMGDKWLCHPRNAVQPK